jgi:hypothetical protein
MSRRTSISLAHALVMCLFFVALASSVLLRTSRGTHAHFVCMHPDLVCASALRERLHFHRPQYPYRPVLWLGGSMLMAEL